MLDHLFTPFSGKTALFGKDLAKDDADFARHAGGVTADVEAGFLLQEVADEGGVLTQPVLDVNLLVGFTGEGGDDLQRVSELFPKGLRK